MAPRCAIGEYSARVRCGGAMRACFTALLHPLIALAIEQIARPPARRRRLRGRRGRGEKSKPQQRHSREHADGTRSDCDGRTQRNGKASTIPNRLSTRCGAFAAVSGFLGLCHFGIRPILALGGACPTALRAQIRRCRARRTRDRLATASRFPTRIRVAGAGAASRHSPSR